MSSLRVGIVGCGRMGQERARSAAACGARVSMVHDADRERAETLARRFEGCRVAADAFDVVRDAPSAVFICTPPSSRGPVELAAIGAGIPLFVEKPIAVSAGQIAAVREKLRTANLVHAVGYQNRCRTSVRHARQALAGTSILGVSAFWVGRKYMVPWWLRPEESGGPVNEQATHLIDLCRFFCGEIASARSEIGSAFQPVSGDPLTAAIILRFENGTFGSLLYSCQAQDKQIGVRIVTTAGGITLSGWDLKMAHNEIDGTGISDAGEDIFAVETQQFLDAVQRGDPSAVPCTMEDAWRTQLAVDGITRGTTK